MSLDENGRKEITRMAFRKRVATGSSIGCDLTEKKATRLKPWLPEKWDFEVDVVVVGYGGAGACAAIASHDTGAKVLILEKAPVGGGNTSTSGGGSAIPDDLHKGLEYYRALTQGMVDEELIRTLAEAIYKLPYWLKELGADLEYFSSQPLYPALPGASAFQQIARLSRTARQIKEGMFWTYGNHLFDFLDNQVKRRKIKVMYEAAAKELVQDSVTKEILGVKVESFGGEAYVKARRGVILTCGGFENNREMLVNFSPYATELPIYPLGTPYNTGDGILMASEVGAKLWHMASPELGNFAPKAPSEKFGVGFRLLRQLPVDSEVIYINKYGKRFMNESILLSHRRELFKVQHFDCERVEYPNIPFYMVFDETFRMKGPIVETRYGWWSMQKLYKWSDDNSAEIELGWILKADTIRELAEKIDVDSDALEETISKYDECCAIGEDSEFGRSKEWLVPIGTPPYYATELCEPIINTQGGPKHNAQSQVLDKNDKPIPRLYAAGELGSAFFPLYQTCSNIPEALAFGRIAGEHSAALMPWE
ncbi:FAD-dependent oxidoreductase [Chloroflexota bacterium]